MDLGRGEKGVSQPELSEARTWWGSGAEGTLGMGGSAALGSVWVEGGCMCLWHRVPPHLKWAREDPGGRAEPPRLPLQNPPPAPDLS